MSADRRDMSALHFIEKSHHVPANGDIFLLRITEQDYLVARVVDAAVADSQWGRTFEGSCLIYVFDIRTDGTSIPASLPVSKLLLPPIIVGRDLWLDGYAKHVVNREFYDGERFKRHCFKSLISNKPCYYDERARRVPKPFEPCVDGIISLAQGLDERIAKELGITLASGAAEPGELEVVENQFIVVIPDPPVDDADVGPDLDIMTIERTLERALKRAKASKAGEWEGHGYDMELRCWDIRFEGPDPKRMSEVMLPVLKGLKLPRGSYVLVGGKRSERVDL